MEQLRLLNEMPSRQLRPESCRSAPSLWVRELMVLREMKPGDASIVRHMRFRRGLNILWTKPLTGDREHGPFKNGLHAHTAGKTTFCRLLRFMLGEHTFGDDALQKAVRRKFPDGWVIAQVMIENAEWLVGRPLSPAFDPFATRGVSVDQLHDSTLVRGDFEEYLAAVRKVVLSPLPVKTFPVSGADILWEHILPWLARDQECRLAKLLEWRDTSSESGSPSLDAESRQVVVRTLLNLISAAEARELVKNEQLNQEKEAARLRLPVLAHQAQTDRGRLIEASQQDLPPFDDGLYANEVDKAVAARQTGLDAAEHEAAKLLEDIKQTNDQLSDALKAEGEANENHKNAEKHLRGGRNRLEACQKQLTGKDRDEFFRQLQTDELCNVPIAEAIRAGCPLAPDPRHLFEAGKVNVDFRAEADRLQPVIAGYQAAVKEKSDVLKQCKSVASTLQTELNEKRRQHSEMIVSNTRRQEQLAHLRTLAKQAHETWKESRRLQQRMVKLEQEATASRKRQEDIRKDREKVLRRLSALFDYVVRALLGGDLEGVVEFSGRSVELKVEYRGERRSTALQTMKIVAFDIAAVLLSVEGEGFHPRLLIHDSPQEGGLDPAVYRNIFSFCRDLEGCFGKHEPSFQYFITTTEPPPKDMAKSPWLLEPVLDASQPETRFLGVDL